MQKPRQDIEELLSQAEKTDSEGAADEQKLTREIARREALLERMRWAGRNHPGSRLILGTVQRVLADGRYENAEQIEAVGSTVDLVVAITSEDTSQRRYDNRPPKKSHPKKVTVKAPA